MFLRHYSAFGPTVAGLVHRHNYTCRQKQPPLKEKLGRIENFSKDFEMLCQIQVLTYQKVRMKQANVLRIDVILASICKMKCLENVSFVIIYTVS